MVKNYNDYLDRLYSRNLKRREKRIFREFVAKLDDLIDYLYRQTRIMKVELAEKAGFNPNQPRHPAGSGDISGQWSGGSDGGSSDNLTGVGIGNPGNSRISSNLDSVIRKPGSGNSLQASDKRTFNRAKAIYGETSGLTPSLKNLNGNPYNPSNWDSNSAEQLKKAREFIGIVSERNPKVHFAIPSE